MRTREGLILKRAIWGETDHRIWILTKEGELVEVVAKNTGAHSSKRRAHLEPLSHIQFNVHSNKQRHYLREIVSLNGFTVLKNNWDSLIRAELLAEIILSVSEQEECSSHLYPTCMQTLKYLEENPNGLGLEWGLAHIAHEWGHLPNFKECPHCFLQLSSADCPACQVNPHPDIPFEYRKAIEFLKQSSGNEVHRLKLSEDERLTLNGILLNGFSAYWSRPPRSLAWLSNAPLKTAPQTSV